MNKFIPILFIITFTGLSVSEANQQKGVKVKNETLPVKNENLLHKINISDRNQIKPSPIKGFIIFTFETGDSRHLPVSEIIQIDEWFEGVTIRFKPIVAEVGNFCQSIFIEEEAMSSDEVIKLIKACQK